MILCFLSKTLNVSDDEGPPHKPKEVQNQTPSEGSGGSGLGSVCAVLRAREARTLLFDMPLFISNNKPNFNSAALLC